MIVAYLLLLLMIILWGFSFVLVDISVEYMTPLSIALYRFLIASLTFLLIDIYLKVTGKGKSNNKDEEFSKFTKQDWLFIIIASFSGISVFFLCQYNAINLIGPSLPALFICLLSPVLISILALVFFKEKLNSIKIVGFCIASVGAFLLVTGGNIATLTPASPSFLGYIFALMTPLLWAIYATVTKKITSSSSDLDMLKYICYLGTIELLIFVTFSGELMIFLNSALNIILLLAAIYLGLGCYVLGYYIWQNSQKKFKSSKVASFLYVEPFLTLMFSTLLQRNETIVLWNLIGGIIVLIAVLIINKKTTPD